VLIEWAEAAKRTHSFQTGMLTMDVDGGFGNVKLSGLIDRMKQLYIPIYLISWVTSFLQDRKISLRADGKQLRQFNLSGGVPQGSPISPLLFAMFISPIVKNFDQEFQDGFFAFSLSYVNDIALVVCGPNGPRITFLLSWKAVCMINLAEQLGFSFSVAKTEFIFLNSEEQDIELSITIQQHTFPNQALL
jgi:hypothetical protein